MYNGTISDLENIITNLMQQDAVSDSTRLTENMLLVALNNTRRAAERNWDFYYSQVNVSIDIPATGADLSSNYSGANTATVTGSLNPLVAGTWLLAGTRNGAPLFTINVGGTDYFLSFLNTEWIMAAGITPGSNYWRLITNVPNPTGTYTAVGTNTGTPIVTVNYSTADIKRIEFVSLPVRNGGLQPIEYLDNDTWIARVKRQIGRQNFNPQMSLSDLGVYYPNPLVYQNGQTLFLQPPEQFTFPLVGANLNVTQFLPDYTDGTDTDFFVQNAPDFLQWGACLEINRLWKEFVNRQEGNISDDQIQKNYAYAWEALIRWDISISGGMANQLPIPPAPQIYAQPEAQQAA